jgi:hypothetical protein
MDQCFHVLFIRPGGWTYDLWPRATGKVEAVASANELLEYVERIGISDYLEADGVTVRGDAELRISPVPEPPKSDVHLRITRPDGSVVEK